MNQKRLDCPHCKYKFVSFLFSGMSRAICPYCNGKVLF